MLFDIGICIFASLWRSTVNAGLNVILKDIDRSKESITKFREKTRGRASRHLVSSSKFNRSKYRVI